MGLLHFSLIQFYGREYFKQSVKWYCTFSLHTTKTQGHCIGYSWISILNFKMHIGVHLIYFEVQESLFISACP